MSRPRLAMLLLFVVAAIGMVDPGVAVPATRTHGHHPPLLHCGPAPVLSKNADATFRADLTSALAQLPSAAAAKRDAFATVQIGKAFARGACFVANVSTSPATTRACEACLHEAARDVTGGCRTSGQKMYIEEVIVVGYICFLRVQISALPKGPEYGGGTVVGVVFGICLHLLFQAAAISLGILLIRVIMLACELPQVNNG